MELDDREMVELGITEDNTPAVEKPTSACDTGVEDGSVSVYVEAVGEAAMVTGDEEVVARTLTWDPTIVAWLVGWLDQNVNVPVATSKTTADCGVIPEILPVAPAMLPLTVI